jgi:DNA-binding GntR family transcriptional regulator
MRKKILFKDEEISREIEMHILNGHFKEGSRLPSERKIAEDHGVQRDTVRSALNILIRKGMLIREPRRGYYVAPHRVEFDLNNFRSIKSVIESIGRENNAILLSFEKICMDKKLAEITRLPEGTFCYLILRLRYFRGKPGSIERSYLIAEHVPGLTREDADRMLIYSLFREKYGIGMASMEQRITQVYASDMEAELLKVSRDEPLIKYEGLIYDRKDRLIEFFDNVIMTENIQFRLRDFA